MLIHRAADFGQRICQWLWRDDITQSQRGVKDLTHRSGVDHPAGIVDSLQARERWPGKAELSIIIVFENESVICTSEIEQSGPAREAHRHSEGKLMRRRNVNDSGQRFAWRSL